MDYFRLNPGLKWLRLVSICILNSTEMVLHQDITDVQVSYALASLLNILHSCQLLYLLLYWMISFLFFFFLKTKQLLHILSHLIGCVNRNRVLLNEMCIFNQSIEINSWADCSTF